MIERDPRCRHAAGMDRGTVQCGLGLYGGSPHVGTCLRACPVRDQADALAILAALPRPMPPARPCSRCRQKGNASRLRRLCEAAAPVLRVVMLGTRIHGLACLVRPRRASMPCPRCHGWRKLLDGGWSFRPASRPLNPPFSGPS